MGEAKVFALKYPKSAWESDSLQFVRLLAELSSVGITDEQSRWLCEIMDISPWDLQSILQRADIAWNNFLDIQEALAKQSIASEV